MKAIPCILFGLSAILFIVLITINWRKDAYYNIIIGIIIGILISLIVISYSIIHYIPPIDVYRGKTTLQVTYEDNIPVDSIVIYKNK